MELVYLATCSPCVQGIFVCQFVMCHPLRPLVFKLRYGVLSGSSGLSQWLCEDNPVMAATHPANPFADFLHITPPHNIPHVPTHCAGQLACIVFWHWLWYHVNISLSIQALASPSPTSLSVYYNQTWLKYWNSLCSVCLYKPLRDGAIHIQCYHRHLGFSAMWPKYEDIWSGESRYHLWFAQEHLICPCACAYEM